MLYCRPREEKGECSQVSHRRRETRTTNADEQLAVLGDVGITQRLSSLLSRLLLGRYKHNRDRRQCNAVKRRREGGRGWDGSPSASFASFSTFARSALSELRLSVCRLSSRSTFSVSASADALFFSE